MLRPGIPRARVCLRAIQKNLALANAQRHDLRHDLRRDHKRPFAWPNHDNALTILTIMALIWVLSGWSLIFTLRVFGAKFTGIVHIFAPDVMALQKIAYLC